MPLVDVEFEDVMRGYPKSSLLSREEEQSIAALPEDHPDRWKLVYHNMRFLVDFAVRFARKRKFYDGWALISSLQDSFIKSSKRFKPQGFLFVSFAATGLKYAAMDESQKQAAPVHLPKWAENTKHLLRESPDYYEFLSHVDTDQHLERLANECGNMQASPSPDEQVINREQREAVTKAIAKLTRGGRFFNESDPRARKVVQEWFGIGDISPTTLTELAKEEGVSRECIRQVKERALRQMRKIKGLEGNI